MSASAQQLGVHYATMPNTDIGKGIIGVDLQRSYHGGGGEIVFGKMIMLSATHAVMSYKERINNSWGGSQSLKVNSEITNVSGGVKIIDRLFVKGGALISWTEVQFVYGGSGGVYGSEESVGSVDPTMGFKYMSKYLISFGVDATLGQNSACLFSLGVNI